MPRETFRRMLVGGYDPSQVRAAIDERDERLMKLEREAQGLARRVIETEQKLQAALLRVAGQDGVVAGVGRRLEEIHAQARRQATRIRMAALEDAVAIADRVGELSRLRDELGSRVSGLAGKAGISMGTGGDSGGDPPAAPAGAHANGAPANGGSTNGVYAGDIEVEIGPLRDFAQLTNFEDAAGRIESASDVHVKRFSGGRATFSMNFAQPVELLRELEERAPFEFKVRDTRTDGIVLDLDEPEAPSAGADAA